MIFILESYVVTYQSPSQQSYFFSVEYKVDLTERLGTIRIPTLLLWGDNDPISPTAMGVKLRPLLLNAALHILEGGTHDLGSEYAVKVASLINKHLSCLAR